MRLARGAAMPKRTFTPTFSSVLALFSGAVVLATACASEGVGGMPQNLGGAGNGDPSTNGGSGSNDGSGGFTPIGPGCGNGVIDEGEACDGSNLLGQTCASATLNAKPDGQLRCTACALDTSACTGGSTAGGSTGAGGGIGTGGIAGSGGEVATGGVPATGGDTSSGGSGAAPGTCCSSGDCLCHGPVPSALTSSAGTFSTSKFTSSLGTVHYPTNAEPPFAGVALCGGFTNTGPEMDAWGPFYASYGIVTIITTTLGTDDPNIRATKLLAAVASLKQENTNASSPLFGKMSNRYGTSGYSMGGGGTTIATTQDSSLRSSIGLAPWGPTGTGVTVPTLLLCGESDTVAPCSMSAGVYPSMSGPKMMMSIAGATHFSWFGPTGAGNGISGETALAFQKVFLEGDERWKPLLLSSHGTVTTNIQ